MRKLLLALSIFAFVTVLFTVQPAYSLDFEGVSTATKIFDLWSSPWMKAKKAEVKAAIEVSKAYFEFDKLSWLDFSKKSEASKKINDAKNKFKEVLGKRVDLEIKIKLGQAKDTGYRIYQGLLTATDIFASLNGDGPVVSSLLSAYDAMSVAVVNYDRASWLNPFKKIKTLNEIRNSSVKTYKAAEDFLASNSYNRLKGLLGKSDGNGGVVGTVGQIGGIIGQVTDILGQIGGIFNAPADLKNQAAQQAAGDTKTPAFSSADVNPGSGLPSNATFEQKMRRYNALMTQYYSMIKSGVDPATMTQMLDEIKTLREDLKNDRSLSR